MCSQNNGSISTIANIIYNPRTWIKPISNLPFCIYCEYYNKELTNLFECSHGLKFCCSNHVNGLGQEKFCLWGEFLTHSKRVVGLRPLVVGPRKKFVLIWILLHASLFYWDCTFWKMSKWIGCGTQWIHKCWSNPKPCSITKTAPSFGTGVTFHMDNVNLQEK